MSEEAVKSRVDDFFDVYDDEDDDSMANKFMTFMVGEECFGVAIEYILEIIELQKITEVPDMPYYVKGVINLRGKIIPVIDLRLRFSLNERAYDDRTCIIVTDIHETPMGFIVDTVSEVANIPEEDISEPPKFKNGNEKEKYIKGLGKVDNKVKIILDIEKVIFEKDFGGVQKLSKNEQPQTKKG